MPIVGRALASIMRASGQSDDPCMVLTLCIGTPSARGSSTLCLACLSTAVGHRTVRTTYQRIRTYRTVEKVIYKERSMKVR